jgi:hypothetical protein
VSKKRRMGCKAFQNSWNVRPPEMLAEVLIECGDFTRGLILLDYAKVSRRGRLRPIGIPGNLLVFRKSQMNLVSKLHAGGKLECARSA